MISDLQILELMDTLYGLAAPKVGPFDEVWREKDDFGLNVGIKDLGEEMLFLFRGSLTPEDWGRDAISGLPDIFQGHHFPLGFTEGMPDVLPKLVVASKEKPVILAGHSLGAAHAAIVFKIWNGSPHFISRCVLAGCPHMTLDPAESLPDVVSYKNGNDFVTMVPPAPWGPLVPFTSLDGGHGPIGLFMYHHIQFYMDGLKKLSHAS